MEQSSERQAVAGKVDATGASYASKNPKTWQLILLASLAFPVYLETLDYTVVATAQSDIASAFHRLDLQSWIGTSYLLTSTVFLPIFASIADIFSRHACLQLSLLIFMVGSAVSTGAQNMAMMLAGRGIAGVGAAGLLVVVRVIIGDSRSIASNSAQWLLLLLLYAAGYSTGPVIGGNLLKVSFRWIFAINLPGCALSMFLGFFLLRGRTKKGRALPTWQQEPERSSRASWAAKVLRIDWIGGTLFIGAGLLILLALNWGSNEKWRSAKVIVSLVVGGLLLVATVAWAYILETRQKAVPGDRPLHSVFRVASILPLDVLRSKDISICQYASFVSGMVMIVMFYFVAIFLVVAKGLDAAKAGVQLVYFAPGMGVGACIVIFIVRWLQQPRYAIQFSGVVTTVALGLIANSIAKDNQTEVNWFLAMAGLGTGLATSSLALQARFIIHEDRNAVVTALTLFTRTLGGTVGLAQCGAVMNNNVRTALTTAIVSGAFSPSDLSKLAGSSPDSVSVISSLSPAGQSIIRGAYRVGIEWCFYSMVPWYGLSFITTLLLGKVREDTRMEKKDEKVGETIDMQERGTRPIGDGSSKGGNIAQSKA